MHKPGVRCWMTTEKRLRSKLSSTIEDLTALLDTIDYIESPIKDLMLVIITDVFKTSYKMGVIDSAGAAVKVATTIERQLATLSKISDDTPDSLLSMHVSVNVIVGRVTKAILQLEKDELH